MRPAKAEVIFIMGICPVILVKDEHFDVLHQLHFLIVVVVRHSLVTLSHPKKLF
jgi:hypothetical protein